MNYNFDERLAYVEEGDEITLKTRENVYEVTVDEIEYSNNGENQVESVRITPEDLSGKGQIFTYRRSRSNPYKSDSFQPDKVVDYELEDSWNTGLGSEEALEKVSTVLEWNSNSTKEAVALLND